MGYTTDFNGHFELDKKLTDAQAEYLRAFAETRHIKRDVKALCAPEPIREAVCLPPGVEGEYCALGECSDGAVGHSDSPRTPPGLYCQWVPTDDNQGIEWDGGEKFYDYVEWLEYIVKNFLVPWGITIHGEVEWIGEDSNDRGVLFAHKDKVAAVECEFTIKAPKWYKKAVKHGK